uniref:N-acetyltransferase domain-containing protein n=1 Tax=Arcella intermedia TaxID=1963864 RepID=A0A6B2LFG1_9EUKA
MVNPALIRTFKETLLGREPNTMMIRSPYSNRLLKPFIWRDYETRIQKALVMHQLLLYCNRKNQRYKCPPMKPIDYCYIQPEHIRQVNHLLCDTFWPGIDISDSLLTPDYTVVATYGKLVIGVALMTPIGYITYICVSPYWRRYKIATFMLYHLLQACPDKDITLHVSATNNAMLLYNQFGFKPEEYIIGFYSKYMPEGTEESKNAFLLRLRR